MKLAFFNNNINHHQVYVADEFYRLLGADYMYITTSVFNVNSLKGGKDYSTRPYLLMAAASSLNKQKAMALAKTAEVCIFGAESLEYAIARAKQKNCGLAFELSERWMKKGWLNVLSPHLLRWWWNYQTLFRYKPFYKLNASAFASKDHARLFSYKGRCYKWGYFTTVDRSFKVEAPVSDVSTSEIRHTIMWCGRFLKWKHPELPVLALARLKAKGYKFILDFYGSGIQEKATKELVRKLRLDNYIKFHGEVPNTQVLSEMRKHHIFLFTSDRNEGWGAVSNEAMASGCVLVASDAIGSAPFLIQDCVNGLLFKSRNADSLEQKIQWLFDHPMEVQKMRKEAPKTMTELWSPQKAAENLLILIDDLQHNRKDSILNGPASIAAIM